MKKHLLSLIVVSMFALVGCKKTTAGSPDDGVIETSSRTTATSTSQIETSAREDAPGDVVEEKVDTRSIALAMGCPEDKLTEDGCDTCAGSWSVEEGDSGGLVQSLKLRPGTYSDSGEQQVYITYFGCGSRAGGDSHNVLLERDGSAWKIARRTTYKDNQTCKFLKQKDGIEHVLCVNAHGSQGVEFQELVSPGFSNYKAIDATADEPQEIGFDTFGGFTFASTTNEDLEEEDGALPPAPSIEIAGVEDIDKDGDQDARIVIDGNNYNIVIDHDARTMTLSTP